MADARASGGVRPLYSNGYKAAVLGLLLAVKSFCCVRELLLCS